MRKRLILLTAISIWLVSAIFLAVPADTILNDFQVNTEFPGHPPQDSPYSVANWQTQRIYTTFLSKHDGANWDVALARHNYDLQPVGQTTYLNVREGTYNCLRPKLVIRSTGVGAAWIEARSPNRIMFRSLDGNGNPTCPPVRVEGDFSNVLRDSLSIAALYDGFLLVWYDGRDASKIWAQKVDLSGQLIGPNFPIQPDSAGSILGLEAQNHPDGRVLVSWVTNGQYSRGRWLDSLGNFMGEVFEMAEASPGGSVFGTQVRFGYGGDTGLLYQYKLLWDIYYAYLDAQGLQASQWLHDGYWEGEFEPYGWWQLRFPSLICLSDSHMIKAYVGKNVDYEMGTTYSNDIYSSVSNLNIHPYGIPGGYGLCLLSPQTFLYSYDPSEVALRKYAVDLLDSTSITWIAEPGFGSAQRNSELCLHQDGGFRIIYNNWFSIENHLYSRYYDAGGVPSGLDTIVSLSQDLLPVVTNLSRMEITGTDEALVAWPYAGQVCGSQFSDQYWNGNIGIFQFSPGSNRFHPNLDVNNDDHVLLVWQYTWYSWSWEWWYSRLYFRHFSPIYNPASDSIPLTQATDFDLNPGGWDVCLRDDGRFIICYNDPIGGPELEVIQVQRGINYQELIGPPNLISPLIDFSSCAPPVAEISPDGYWITWILSMWDEPPPKQLYLQRLDSDGSPLGDCEVISSDDASLLQSWSVPTYDLAISASGTFAICWQDARNDSGDIYCRQFNPDGSIFGNEYRVNSDPVGVMQKEPAVAFGPEDRLYFTWTDFRNPGGQGDIFCKVIEWEDALDAPVYHPPLPKKFALYPPSPNPFNGVTAISFQLPADSYVNLRVYDTAGRLVGTLVDSRIEAGSHQVIFEGSDLASGIYIARLQAGDFVGVEKLVLLK